MIKCVHIITALKSVLETWYHFHLFSTFIKGISSSQSDSKTEALDCSGIIISVINLVGHVYLLNVNDENALIPGYC